WNSSQRERAAAQRRLYELNLAFREALRAILTPEQLAHLRSVPPLLSPQDCRDGLGNLSQQIQLRPLQQQQLEQLRRRLRRRTSAIQQESRRELESLRGEIGADSPQAMMMEMMQAGTRAEMYVLRDGMTRHAVLEVLDPEQVIRWVVTPGERR
ncbi:MAG: hypothetical protein ACE5JG_09280, partial [Planctomycetota bacterium]